MQKHWISISSLLEFDYPDFLSTIFIVLVDQIIPLAWAEKRISLINQYVFIRIGEKLWRPRLNYNKLRKCAALTSGWKYFAVDNNLEESDVCVFEPGGTINGTVVLDVKIFRVIQEFVALTMVSQTSSSAKRKKRDIEDERDEEDVKDEEEDEEELFMWVFWYKRPEFVQYLAEWFG